MLRRTLLYIMVSLVVWSTVNAETFVVPNDATPYRFVGFSTGQINGTGGYNSRYALCQMDYGSYARMCTSKEYILSSKVSSAPSYRAWLNPEIVAAAPNAEGLTISVDYSGQIAIPSAHSCEQWYRNDAGISGLTITENGAIRLSPCNEARAVACCTRYGITK